MGETVEVEGVKDLDCTCWRHGVVLLPWVLVTWDSRVTTESEAESRVDMLWRVELSNSFVDETGVRCAVMCLLEGLPVIEVNVEG